MDDTRIADKEYKLTLTACGFNVYVCLRILYKNAIYINKCEYV